MNALSEYLNLGLGALFLQADAYAKMREDSRRVFKGFVFIVLVGVIVALFAVVGQVLEWSVTPDLSNLKNIVLDEMRRTQWFREMAGNPQAMQGFQQGYDLWWQIFGSMFGVNVLGALANVIVNPLALSLRWLIYGIVAFVCARLLGGKGNLSQTLGCTALAIAPEMFKVLQVFPYVELGGLALWGIVCSYLGIKTANQLSPWRAFWATLLPFIVLAVLAILVGCIGGWAVGSLMSAGGQR
jgi:hypothetical protein